jgi:hypothetical protein
MRLFYNVNIEMNKRIRSFENAYFKICNVYVGKLKTYIENQTYTSNQNRCMGSKTCVCVVISMYAQENST